MFEALMFYISYYMFDYVQLGFYALFFYMHSKWILKHKPNNNEGMKCAFINSNDPANAA